MLEKSSSINRSPARWDLIQAASGLFLVLFMWMHMFMVSSILLGKDTMYFISRMFEGEPIFGKPIPQLVSGFAVFILLVVVIHAIFAMRKFPSSYQQYKAIGKHSLNLKHQDTWLWLIQIGTGFLLMFLIPIHLYQLIVHPADIGPYASSDRIWSGRMWPLYMILLFAVEFHAVIGLYRLAIKWGLVIVKNPIKNRLILSRLKWCLLIFFFVLGEVTLQAYMKIGREHADRVGERYIKMEDQNKAVGDHKEF